MMSRIRTIAALAILAAALGRPSGAVQAQNEVRLSSLTIRLWPEFDRPSVLVFLIGQTATGTPLPADLKFTIPQTGTVNAIAYIDAEKDVLSDNVPSKVEGQDVTITSPNGNFHLEFYDTALQTDGALRTYTYTWQQNFAVDAVQIEVQQPAGASSFTVEPTGGAMGTDENGLGAYRLSSGPVAAGQAVTISVSYSKQDNTLSVDTISVGAQTPAPVTTQPAGADNTLGIVIGAVILALVVVGIAVMYLRGGFQGFGVRVVGADAQPVRERKPRGRAAKKLGKKPAPGQRFCPQCGQPARPGDLFCRSCGTKLHG